MNFPAVMKHDEENDEGDATDAAHDDTNESRHGYALG
jgi:hypothetical protein